MQNLTLIEIETAASDISPRYSDYLVVNHRGRCVEIRIGAMVATLTAAEIEALMPKLKSAHRLLENDRARVSNFVANVEKLKQEV